MTQNLLISVFIIINSIMLSNLPDSDALVGAVGMAGQLGWLLNIVIFGIVSGAAVFISQYWGVSDLSGIHRSFGLALIYGAIISFAFTCAGLFLAEPVMRIWLSLDSGNDVTAYMDAGTAYLRIVCFGYMGVMFQLVLSAVLRSTEQVKLPMVSGIAAALTDVLLNYLFIYKMGMGVRGAALGTAIACWISPAILILLSLKRRNLLIAPLHALFRWPRGFVKSYLGTSFPVLLNELLWALGGIGSKLIISNRDPQFYSAMSVCFSVDGFLFAFYLGIGHACTVIVGKSVGAGDRDSSLRDARRFMLIQPALGIIVGVLLLTMRDAFLLPFGISDETRATARSILMVTAFITTFRSISFICIVGIFRASGDTRAGLKYDTASVWLFALPITFFSAYVLHLPLIWVFAIMVFVEEGIKSTLCLRRFKSGKWYMPVTAGARAAVAAEE
jgi:putative MATE family efflux protein